MYTQDPLFWRAGAIAMSLFMCVVLAALTIDTLSQITPGGTRVPSYDVINSSISYRYDPKRGEYVPKIGGEELKIPPQDGSG
jgi:nitric oxide reductase subunit C